MARLLGNAPAPSFPRTSVTPLPLEAAGPGEQAHAAALAVPPEPAHPWRRSLVRASARLELLAVAVAGTAAVALPGASPVLAAVVALAWLVVSSRHGGSGPFAGLPTTGAAALGAGTLVLALTPVPGSVEEVCLVAGFLAAVVAGVRLLVHALRGRPRVVVLVGARASETVRLRGRAQVVATLAVDVALDRHRDVLARLVRSAGADAVAVAPGLLARTDLAALARRLEGTDVPVVLVLDRIAGRRVRVGAARGAYGRTLVSVTPPGPSRATRWTGAVLDRVLGALLLVLSAPLLVGALVLVRLDSRGPALFRQERVGRHGRRFVMLKIRTMHQGAEAQRARLAARNDADGALFKLRSDPRVTRVGRWLRRTSLDELPQLWNVLRGDMSLVGPRPALPGEVAAYDEQARRRLAVKPGLTGPWQVGGRSDLPWSVAVDLDVAYADNHSVAGDLVICARTVSAVVRAKGAY
ncbi:sugar transferase [Nocardioides zeae]|uniref:Sugar transferase n=1 Tax=Nocardioides imazamoxiresistens TaxID=3231893 RepID=A0ABU3PYS3_9ACTN|nr:sugar transferase [Nocardioides zeae]MDT9594385.1 sugar transferase [Nocardioides zeae]